MPKSAWYQWKFPIIGNAWGIPAKSTAMLNVATGVGGEPDGLIEHFWVYGNGSVWRAACDETLIAPAIEIFSNIAILGLYHGSDQRCAVCKQRRQLFGLNFDTYFKQWLKDKQKAKGEYENG